MTENRVMLEVYDLSNGMAATMSQQFLGTQLDGIWHTGVVVFNREYYFGGGIQVAPVGQFAREHRMRPVHTLDMGLTTKTQAELSTYLTSIRPRFTQATYDLLRNNCNNFSDVVTQFLCNHGIPEYIIDLPNKALSTPMGQMLRPMIEGMQNNIQNSSGSGMDPFGGSGGGGGGGALQYQQQQQWQQQPQYAAVAPVQPAPIAAPVPMALSVPSTCALEDCALISGDTSTVHIMGNKILNVPGADAVKGTGLSEEEKQIVQRIVSTLQQQSSVGASVGGATSTSAETITGPFNMVAYVTLESIMERFPSTQMACLFLLRLMVLRDDHPAAVYEGLVRAVVTRLKAAQDSGSSDSSFSGIPSHVMALCTLSNLLSHYAGLTFVFKGPQIASSPTDHVAAAVASAPAQATSPAVRAAPQAAVAHANSSANATNALICDIIDVAMAGLGHNRTEIRQISATIAYNIALSCSSSHRAARSLWDRIVEETQDLDDICLHQHLVQIMCGCVESSVREQDPAVRKRELAAVCHILRSYGKPAAELLNDLGATVVSASAMSATTAETTAVESMADLRLMLRRQATQQKRSVVPAEDELTIVTEILHMVTQKTA